MAAVLTFCNAALSGAAMAGSAPTQAAQADWRAFKRRYLSPEGRVVDTGNAGVSHSEGQSYGMMLAVHMDDRPAFDLMWDWARNALRRRPDALMAWRWRPDTDPPVRDLNNATDGDLVAAWALARAGARWSAPDLTAEAARIARDVLRLCTIEWQGKLLLLPGANGFRQPEGTVVNPSYYAWGAIRALSRVAPDPAWARLEADGLELLRQARFGRFGLPPDWLMVRADGRGEAWRERPPRLSWDAVRVPLHLVWASLERPVMERCLAFWQSEFRFRPPAWIDLISGFTPPYAGHAGIRAVIRAIGSRLGATAAADETVAAAQDYYGASLVMLARLALTDTPEPPALVPAAPAPAPAAEAPAAPSRFEFLRRPFGTAPAPSAPAPTPPAAPPPPAAMPRGVQPGIRVAPPHWRPDVP